MPVSNPPQVWILGLLRYMQGKWVLTNIDCYSEATPTHMRDTAFIALEAGDVFGGRDYEHALKNPRVQQKLEYYRTRFPGVLVQQRARGVLAPLR